MKLFEFKENSDHDIWIIETLYKKDNVVIMLPNFVWDYPVAGWDYVANKWWIESYGKWISPFTETLSENGKNKIIQINYPNDGNFYFTFKKIIKSLEEKNLKEKKITVYGQSMWGKVALYLAYFLIKNWFKIDKIVLNSSVIDKETISVPFIHLPSTIAAPLFKILKYIPSKFLVWILSAAKDDPDNEVSYNDLIKVVNNLKWYNVKYKQIKTRLDFMKKNFHKKVIETIKEANIPILVIKSNPPVKNSKDDWMVKHIFLDKLKEMFPNQVKSTEVSSRHCQVPEKNRKYAKALQELLTM